MYENIKVFGERHTGTKYLLKLIELNMPEFNIVQGTGSWVLEKLYYRPWVELAYDMYFRKTFPKVLGWKHSAVHCAALYEQKIFEKTFFVCLVRNPYSWLLSMHRMPYHAYDMPRSFEDFLVSEWPVLDRDMCRAKNVMDLWNVKNYSYLHSGFYLMKFEDLVCNPRKTIYKLAKRLESDFRYSQFEGYNRSTVHGESRDSDWYKNYYGTEKWRHRLSPRALELIAKGIDWGIAHEFGYMERPCFY
jgi:hypothetical protein